MSEYLIVPIIGGVVALLFAAGRMWWLHRQTPQNSVLIQQADLIKSGVRRFTLRQSILFALFVLLIGVILFFLTDGPMRFIMVSLITGAVLTTTASACGVWASTASNIRTAEASSRSTFLALQTALRGGSVMGLSVVGLVLTGLTLLFLLFTQVADCGALSLECTVLPVLSGYALGAGIVALLGRMAGGIYAKAADVSADTVGKNEFGLDEDDPRNPASLADNIGDNVADIGGLGLDAGESYVGSIAGAMIIGASMKSTSLTYLPLILMTAGIAASIIAYYLVRMPDYGNPYKAIFRGIVSGDLLALGFGFMIMFYMFPADTAIRITGAYAVGISTGILISYITNYYTSRTRSPVVGIAGMTEFGAPPAITEGMAVGMLAVGLPILLFSAAAFAAFQSFGIYGLGIAAVGLLAGSGIQVAVDASGPITDNAGGLAVRAQLTPATRERTDKLDAVGNLFNAVGKGYSIISAAFTTLVLFIAYKEVAEIELIDLTQLPVLLGIFLGGAFPFAFSAFILSAVNRVSVVLIGEVRKILARHPMDSLIDEPHLEEIPIYEKFNRLIEIESFRRVLLPSLLARSGSDFNMACGRRNYAGRFFNRRSGKRNYAGSVDEYCRSRLG
ncbi:MAG: sodium/proton-translocating pyrophosphatase [Spirochaetia bacterium]|nr:sodium/proton-translocating pyrophosphatase [Spirochaetia bacterium]